ncbi:MAG: hypothetical protein ACRD96_12865 [Bryobacteraceae bacterium]
MGFRAWILCIAAGLSLAQEKKSPPPKEEPAPLFGGQLGVRSSEKTKESATLGFNGIDPAGKVGQQILAAGAGEKEQAQVSKMSEQRPNAAALKAFVEEGGLKSR